MEKIIHFTLILVFLQSLSMAAQKDSIQVLEEVVLDDVRLYESSLGHRLQKLDPSQVSKRDPDLSGILKFHTPLYFKEQGPGMVSSVSYRGTTASQTAVVWNGININSPFHGQTDFNTILAANYDQIVLRTGGGSNLYGSGAIAGSVHLVDQLEFGKGLSNHLMLQYGSFETFSGNFSAEYSSEKVSIEVDLSRHNSENDYPFPGSTGVNSNGDFRKTAFSFAMALKLDHLNQLRFFSDFFYGDRGISGTRTVPSKSAYIDRNSRNLLEWRRNSSSFTTNLQLAYLDEGYGYYENRNYSETGSGRAKTGIAKYDLEYTLSEEMSISGIGQVKYTAASGTNIGEAKRTTGSVGILFEHELNALSFELSGRQEISGTYSSPLLFSAGAGYRFSENYRLYFNISRNFRAPTLNDLYWYAGGNVQLDPERSLQAELGQELRLGDLSLEVVVFGLQVKELLQWVPGSDGLWKPVNVKSIRNYGVEGELSWDKTLFGQILRFSTTYAFTRSRDLLRNKELMFVPRHKATAGISYELAKGMLYYQALYTGPVFTSSDNIYSLDGYTVSNIGIDYLIFPKHLIHLGLEVNNLWNTSYESMPSRPMPGRAFSTSLTLKF